jgi:hypothetical protein
MKKLYFLTFFLCIITISFSQSSIWVEQISAIDLKYVKSVEDTDANLFIAGMFTDSLQLDSQSLVVGIGSFQFFVAKFDALQNLIGYQIYYTDYEFERPLVKHLEIDNLGQLYLSGNFYNGLYDTQGDTLLFTVTSLDDFVMKFDNDLQRQWVHRIGGSNNTDAVNKIKVTDQGDLFLAGAMSRTFDYDLLENTFSLAGGNSGSPFLVKYDADLNLQWARVLQSVKRDGVLDIVQASDGSIYTVTQISDTVFVPSTIDTLLLESTGDIDLMVNKWSTAGDILWTQLVQGAGRETFYNAEIDDAGFLYIYLQSNSQTLSIGANDLNQKKGNDLILIKLNADSSIEWTNQMASSSRESQGKLLILEDRFILSGTYSSTLSLNSRDEDIEISVLAGEDYLASYNVDGDLMTVTTLSGNRMSQKTDLRVNHLGQILAAAPINFSTSFYPLPSGIIYPSLPTNSVIAKFCLPILTSLAVDTLCIDGQLALSANPNSVTTNYYLPETDEIFTNQDTFFLSNENPSVIILHFDQNQCPLYEMIDQTGISCSTTPTSDFSQDTEMRIFPNPFTADLELTWTKKIRAQYLFLFNSLGQMVLRQNMNTHNQGEASLKLDHLTEGVYHLHLHTDTGLLTRKLIKI